MSNDKQSSVEWLQAIELERDLTLADWKKAKAMHEVEIRMAFYDGQLHEGTKSAIDYNETFGE